MGFGGSGGQLEIVYDRVAVPLDQIAVLVEIGADADRGYSNLPASESAIFFASHKCPYGSFGSKTAAFSAENYTIRVDKNPLPVGLSFVPRALKPITVGTADTIVGKRLLHGLNIFWRLRLRRRHGQSKSQQQWETVHRSFSANGEAQMLRHADRNSFQVRLLPDSVS